MTIEALSDALDRYGGDFARWPADLAEEARRVAEHDPRFAAALAEARRFDDVLSSGLAAPPLPLGYATRIAARARAAANERSERFSLRWVLALGSGWAVAATLAGIVYADLLGQYDIDAATLAEIALGAAPYLTGN